MKTKFVTLFLVVMTLFGIGTRVNAQTPTTTNPVLTGITYYNIIYTTGGVDYYATFDPVSYDFSFSPLVPGSNTQAFTFAFQTTDGTWGNCFYIYSLSNANNFLSENANWKSATYTGSAIPNPGTTDSWKKFYFVKDNVTGLYAIRPSANNNGKCWAVPTLSTNNKIGVSAYFTAQGTQGSIPAQGDALYCFKIQEATVVDQKPALSGLYDSCLSLYNSSVEGTAVGNYATGSRADFKGKIDAAKVVIDNASATAVEVGTAYGTLQTSLVWFRNKVVTNNHLLGDGYYYIYTKNPDGTKYYLTDKDPHTDATAAVQPVDYELAATVDALKYQQFKVTWDASASRYKIEGRYRLDNSTLYTHAQVNQDFSFDFNAYSTASNTFNIYSDGSVCALKRVAGGYLRPYTTSPGTATTVSTPTNVGSVTFSNSATATINTFMGNSLIYNFEAVPTAATQAELDALQAQITAANALLASTTEGTAAGEYTTANRTVLSDVISSATAVFNTANAYQANVNSATSSLSAAITTYSNSMNVSTTALADGNYTISVSDGTTNYYLTDEAPHADPAVGTSIALGYELQSSGADQAYQVFTLTFDNTAGRYKIEGKYRLDNAYGKSYVNEGGKFGGNAYSADWNTMTITYNGTRYAILSGGAAGVKYWGPASLTAGAVTTLTAASGALLSDHLIYNFAPVSGTPTAVAAEINGNVAVYGGERAIKLEGAINKVLVYDITGQLVKTVEGGVSTIGMESGQYIVKAISNNTTKVVKVIVK